MDFLIHHLLRTTALRSLDKEALVYKKQRLSYAEVAQKTVSLALGLRNYGLQKSERLGIYLDASIEQILSIFAIFQAGGVFVPINTLLFPQQVEILQRLPQTTSGKVNYSALRTREV